MYLLYLGGHLVVPTLRRGDQLPTAVVDAPARSAFAQALLTNRLNPEAVLFLATVLPQFVVPGAPIARQVAALARSTGLLGLAVGHGARVQLSAALRRRRVRLWWDRSTGGLLGGPGGSLLAWPDTG